MFSQNQSYCFNQTDSHSVQFPIVQFFSFPLLSPTYIKLKKQKTFKPMSSPGRLSGGCCMDGVGCCSDGVRGCGDGVGDCGDGIRGCGDGVGGLIDCPLFMML
jgi:hypothetical protein